MKFPAPLPEPPRLDALEISLEFQVKGKGRPRFNGRTGTCYMSKSYVLNKLDIQWVLRSACSFKPGFLAADAIYGLQMVFYRRRRKPKSKADALLMEQQLPLGGLCCGKPDVDNALGTVMDAANSVLYVDDSQVCSSVVERRWSDTDGAFLRIIKMGGYR